MKRMRCLAAAFGLVLVAGCALDPVTVTPVMAAGQTAPMPASGDAADDPAIWLNPADPAASRILGTNKDAGLYVYDLEGNEVQSLLIGLLNNVDIRVMEGGEADIAVASNDEIHAISVFAIAKADGTVSHLGDIPTGKMEPYGICLGQPGGQLQAGVTYKDGTVELWTPLIGEDGPDGALVRRASVRTQPEGCVFDEFHNALFVGEEGRGLWRLDLSDAETRFTAVDMVSDRNGLARDVEGVSIWRGANGAGWIVASAQGRDRFVVYERAAPHRPRGVFSVAASADGAVDGVSHTDGLDIHSGAFPGFPRGLLVVQDDTTGGPERIQNFKLVDWAEVERALGLERLAAE